MIKKVLIFMLALLISIPLAGEDIKDISAMISEPDNLIPDSAMIFIKLKNIQNTLDFLNEKKEYYNIGKVFPEFERQIKLVKEKTGVDLLNTKSLKDAGIDINKSVYIAAFKEGEKSNETVIFIPVTDKKNFPFAFIKLLKKTSTDPNNPDLNPAISTYKNTRVFQISKDIFFTVIDDYFVLTRSGNTLSAVIDLQVKDKLNSLATDTLYKDYKTKFEASSESNIACIFIKKSILDRDKKASLQNDTGNIEEQKTSYNYINYLSLCVDSEPDVISFTGNLSVNRDDPAGDFLLQAITTGLLNKALFAENPTGFHFISLDLEKIKNYLDQSADKNSDLFRQYGKFQNSNTGKNIFKDTALPCSKSFLNVIFMKSKNAGQMDNMVLYIPMKECGKIELTVKKIKDEIKKRHTAEGTFGEEKINGTNSFWFRDDSGNKFNIFEFNGNLYAGNDVEALKKVLDVKDKFFPDIKNGFIKNTDDNTFLLSYTRFDEESFFKAVLMMLAFNKNPGLYGFIGKMESINLIGKKIDNDISLNLNIRMQPAKKQP
jgi:hypothetical protein